MGLADFFKRIKRRMVQIAAFGLYNFHLPNFISGKLYSGTLKKICVPGLNCYSCPAAAFSCPLGAMQAVSSSIKFNASFYVLGFLLAAGVILGRAICGFLCPFGLLQELLHKIPSKKFRLPKWGRFIKYAILLIFVLILPVADTNFAGGGNPAFCQYLCPAGMLEGAIPLLLTHKEIFSALGALFIFKAFILLLVIVFSIFIFRFFCKTMCPLGAIYALFNKISIFHLNVSKTKCLGKTCGKCQSVCPMDVVPYKNPNSAECIRCGKCTKVCPTKALSFLAGAKLYSPESAL